MATVCDEVVAVIGVGIDTARYGHRITFLRADKQPAAPPLDVLESQAGYEELRQALRRLSESHPGAKFHVRIDAAGQYAANLECFLRSLPLPLEISLGEPARNAAYRKAHFPKRKADVSDSFANARYAVVERPPATPGTPPEFLALREVVSQLESQVTQTTRLINQLHNLLGRVFPELARLVLDLRKSWALRLLAAIPRRSAWPGPSRSPWPRFPISRPIRPRPSSRRRSILSPASREKSLKHSSASRCAKSNSAKSSRNVWKSSCIRPSRPSPTGPINC